MSARHYRFTVLGSVLVWFLIGLHFPLMHQIAHHGSLPSTLVMGVVALLLAAGTAGVWRLLSAPGAASTRSRTPDREDGDRD